MRVEGQPGRQHQALLRAADGDIHAPFVVPVVDRAERGDRVDQEQRRMLGGIDRAAHFGDARDHAGGGFVVHHAHRLDGVRLVLAQPRFDRLRVGAGAPVAGDELGLQAEPLGHLLPQRREVAGLVHQDLVAGRKRIDQRGFPGAGARGRIDDDVAGGLEDPLHALEDLLAERAEVRAAMVHGREVDGAQHPVGNVGRSGNLEKMASGGSGHTCLLRLHAKIFIVRNIRATYCA